MQKEEGDRYKASKLHHYYIYMRRMANVKLSYVLLEKSEG